jgi:hypothetical protein
MRGQAALCGTVSRCQPDRQSGLFTGGGPGRREDGPDHPAYSPASRMASTTGHFSDVMNSSQRR